MPDYSLTYDIYTKATRRGRTTGQPVPYHQLECSLKLCESIQHVVDTTLYDGIAKDLAKRMFGKDLSKVVRRRFVPHHVTITETEL